MNLPYVFMAIFIALGIMFYFGGVEQIGPLTEEKHMRRIAVICFVLAVACGLLNSTPN